MHIRYAKETKGKEWEESNESTVLDESSSGRVHDIFRPSADTQRHLKTSGCNDQIRHRLLLTQSKTQRWHYTWIFMAIVLQ